MPRSTIPRTPIPKFTKPELTRADLCARALWYGVNFKTGSLNHKSDASLMSDFAFNFYHFHKNKIRFTPDIFVSDVKEVIKTCGVTNLFRWIKRMDLRKGINSIYKDVYPQFLIAQKKPTRVSSLSVAVVCLEKLNEGLVSHPTSNQFNLASRILFFLSPNLHTFNLNKNIAQYFGLQYRTEVHYREYFELFSKGMVTNQTHLSKFKMPPARDGLDAVTWNEVSRTDWWKRRVLDLAVLLHTSPKVTVDPNLRVYIRRKIKQDEIAATP
jgi:hypothetical protein